MPILVCGGTGTVGGSLVRQLVAAGHDVRVFTRDPGSPAARQLPAGVEVVAGDYGRPDSLAAALQGVERMHLVAMGGALAAPSRLVGTIAEAGVRRLTHLGHSDESRDDDDPLEAPHRALRRAIENSELEWTHVFPGEFMANTRAWIPSIRRESVVREPFGDWRSAMVHEADIAAVTMTALLNDGHAGQVYQPTGPEPVVRRDAVRLIGEAIGRPVRYVELTADEAREHWRDRGYPDQVVEWLLQMGEAPNMNSWVSGVVEKVTGRPGRTFAQWAADHAGEFR